jgi:hypothetical protein
MRSGEMIRETIMIIVYKKRVKERRGVNDSEQQGKYGRERNRIVVYLQV